ncbi:hypothetical protein NVP1193O_138 [Vibrio phage 1.193.O._10N.286.52.C6]|nr:hypothetical protein NVP1193O_138 [Vibrio phage 1.193.O._10N.286.52.C6]
MYYLTDGCTRYYAGQDCSNARIPVWKNHWSRALPFDTMKSAIDFANNNNVGFLGVEYINEGEG